MANDSAGVSYATIYLSALRMGAITDQQGVLPYKFVAGGAYQVEFSSIGHQIVSDTIFLKYEDFYESRRKRPVRYY